MTHDDMDHMHTMAHILAGTDQTYGPTLVLAAFMATTRSMLHACDGRA